jgi:hypothetical protein
MKTPQERLENPFARKWRRYKDAEHEMRHFKAAAPAVIQRILPTLACFPEIEAYTGFHLFNDHPQTLQASFGHRLMFQMTLDGKAASENGASLVYSLGPTGDIAAILFPARSDLARVHENLIFLRIGQRSASRLIDGLRRDLADFVAYELVTSLDGSPSLAQRLRVQWLRLSKRSQRDSGYDKPHTHRPLSDIASALSGKAAGGTFTGIFKVVAPIAAAAALGYLGYATLAARLLG